MNPHRTNFWSPECSHKRLLNRGTPPNMSNCRICEDCWRTFAPPITLGEYVVSNDVGPRIVTADVYEIRT